MRFDLTKRTIALACALTVLAALPAAAADLTVVSKASGPGGASTSTQYFTADRIRTSDGQTDTILELASGRLTMIDHQKREYYETSLAEMREMFEGLGSQMQDNPMLAKMFGGGGEAKLEKGSEARTIAGYACEQYIVSMGSSMRFEIWATDALQPPTHYFDASMARYAALGPMAQSFEKMFQQMRQIEGFPLSTKVSMTMMGRSMDTLTEATEVSEGAIPASAFEIPSGYKKKDSPFQQ